MDECKPLLHGGAKGTRLQAGDGQGRAVQVDPLKPKLKPPTNKLLKLRCVVPLSNFAFKFNLRRYTKATTATTTIGDDGRGSHSSTFRLNLSPFCGIGVHLGLVQGVFGRCQGALRSMRGCSGCILRQKRLRLSKDVEQRNGSGAYTRSPFSST